jgi:hypothetical protein
MGTAERIRPIANDEMTQDSTDRARSSNASRQPLEMVRSTGLDSLSPEEEAELEQKMVELGKLKYGLDEAKAREWAHAFCSSSDAVETSQR